MQHLLQRLLHDVRGNVALALGLAFPVLIGAAGLAVDSAAFYNQQGKMQSVADSAALAVAKELRIYRENLAELEAVGRNRVEALLAEAGIAERPHTTDIRINAELNLIDVSIAMPSIPFIPVDVWGENPIVVSAQAMAYGQSRLCVLGLHDTKNDTIKVDDATLTAPDCAVQSNSTSANGLHVAPSGEIISTVICSSGGVKGDGTFDPEARTDCPQLDDPLIDRPAPAAGGCDFLDMVIKGGRESISPGIYCGGLKIEGGAEVTAEPGIYVISGGKLEVKDHSTLLGEYVSFVFADDPAVFVFDKDTTIDLTAPADGLMAGILFYDNPLSAPDREFTIRSENAHRLLGTVYLPVSRLKIDSRSDVADQSAYTVIVASQIEIKGANLVVNSDYGGTDVPVPEGLGPNSSMVMLSQ